MPTPIDQLKQQDQEWVLREIKAILKEPDRNQVERKRRKLAEALSADYPKIASWIEEDGGLNENNPEHPVLSALPINRRKVASLRNKIVLIKYGGNSMVDETMKHCVITDICILKSIGAIPVVVHGGGPVISRLLGEVGHESRFIEGHRKTDRKIMGYVEMALSGTVNSNIVKLIGLHGFKSVGISGKDGGLVTAKKRIHRVKKGGTVHRSDLGQVGNVHSVNTDLVRTLIAGGYIPVIAPIGVGEDLEDYNINADMFAGHMAAALGAEALVALTDVDGLLIDKDDPSTLIPEITAHAAREEIGRIIRGGMIPKIEACLDALDGGITRAHIVNGMAEHSLLTILLTDQERGTTIIGQDSQSQDVLPGSASSADSITDFAQELTDTYHAPLYKRYPITLVEGHGVRVRDKAGNEYIDALSGIGVNSVGHCHPEVVAAIQEQSRRLIHVSNLYYTESQSRLAQRITKASGMDSVFFTNSGTEAVEGAIKLARRYAGKDETQSTIISMQGCFHGRSAGALSAHSPEQRKAFEPLLPGFKQIPFNDIDALNKAINDSTAAVILEPVQGEGGIRPATAEFLNEVRRLCDKHNAAIILDEIQCGIGRTGSFFAFQQFDITPDIVTSAKAMGGGVPIGAVLAQRQVAASFQAGDHGTTYGGNPLVCAAADAAIRVILEDGLANRALDLGKHMVDRLKKAAESRPCIREVRGRGLMIGVELDFPGKEIVNQMLKRGVLANCTAETVIRFLPPLIISRQDLDTVVDVFISSLDDVTNKTGQPA